MYSIVMVRTDSVVIQNLDESNKNMSWLGNVGKMKGHELNNISTHSTNVKQTVLVKFNCVMYFLINMSKMI